MVDDLNVTAINFDSFGKTKCGQVQVIMWPTVFNAYNLDKLWCENYR